MTRRTTFGQRVTGGAAISSFVSLDDLEIVVEVRLAAAILGKTCRAWKALSIVADAADIVPKFIGKENIGAKVHGLSKALELPTRARQAR